jgi:hypothetical protein
MKGGVKEILGEFLVVFFLPRGGSGIDPAIEVQRQEFWAKLHERWKRKIRLKLVIYRYTAT